MRALWVAGAALAALTVSGCDINTTPKQAKTDCNCTATPPANTTASTTPPTDMHGTDYVPEDHDRYRRHHGYGGHRYPYRPHGDAYHGGHDGHGGYYWRREYSELSVYTYDYHSGSTSTVIGGHAGSYGGASAEAYAAAGSASAYAGAGTSGGYHVVPPGWVDGYGVMHTGGGAYAGAPAHYETGGRDRDRMSSWHGYDADCPDNHR